MVLAKVTFALHGVGGAYHRIGEVLKVGEKSHLLKVGYVEEIGEEVPLAECGCGRMFMAPQKDPADHLRVHRTEDGCKATLTPELQKMVKMAPPLPEMADLRPRTPDERQQKVLWDFEDTVRKIINDSGRTKTLEDALKEIQRVQPALWETRNAVLEELGQLPQATAAR